jgi:hypothetical protein
LRFQAAAVEQVRKVEMELQRQAVVVVMVERV